MAALIVRKGDDKAVLYVRGLSVIKLRRRTEQAIKLKRLHIDWDTRDVEITSEDVADDLSGVTWRVVDTTL